jgi:hypothetical protein
LKLYRKLSHAGEAPSGAAGQLAGLVAGSGVTGSGTATAGEAAGHSQECAHAYVQMEQDVALHVGPFPGVITLDANEWQEGQ